MQAMVGAVEGVIGAPVHEECVQERPSSRGSYISVTVGPVLLHNREQVLTAACKPHDTSCWHATPGIQPHVEPWPGRHAAVQVVRIYAAMKEDERLKWYM